MVVIVYLWLLSSSTDAWLFYGGVLQSHAVMILSACIYTWRWNITIMIININTIKLCHFLSLLNMVRMILLAISWLNKQSKEKNKTICATETLVVSRIILTVATSMIIVFVVIVCIVATVSCVSVASWSSVSRVIADQGFTITHNHNI